MFNTNFQNSDIAAADAEENDVISDTESILYTNTHLKYQIRYPKTWYAMPYIARDEELYKNIVEFSSSYPHENYDRDAKHLLISVQLLTPEIEKMFTEKPQTKILNGKQTKVADLIINNDPAIETITQHDKSLMIADEFRQVASYLIKHGDVVYTLDFVGFSESSPIPPHTRFYRQIAKSFRTL